MLSANWIGDLCNGPLCPTKHLYHRSSTFNFTNIGIEILWNINEINNEICNGAVAGGEGEAVGTLTHVLGYLFGNVFALLEGAHFTTQIGLINGLFGYVIGTLLPALIETILFEFLSGVYGYCFDFKFDLIAALTATVVASTVEYKFEDVLAPCATRIRFNEYATAVPLAPVDIVSERE